MARRSQNGAAIRFASFPRQFLLIVFLAFLSSSASQPQCATAPSSTSAVQSPSHPQTQLPPATAVSALRLRSVSPWRDSSRPSSPLSRTGDSVIKASRKELRAVRFTWPETDSPHSLSRKRISVIDWIEKNKWEENRLPNGCGRPPSLLLLRPLHVSRRSFFEWHGKDTPLAISRSEHKPKKDLVHEKCATFF
jgi:hypothetical protein